MTEQEFVSLLSENYNNIERFKEICRQNPILTMETIFIEPKLGKRIKLNYAQKEVVQRVLDSEDVYALGSRQIAGKSTIALYLAAFLSVFYNNYYVYYISLEASRQCTEFLQNIERIIDNLPFKVEHKRSTLNNAQIVLDNNSVIMTAAVARKKEFSSISKSRTAHFIIIDEFSDIKGNMELLSTISATMAATRKLSQTTKLPTSIILISNAFEIVDEHHQYAYNLWMQSIENKTNYKPVLFYYRSLLGENEANKFIEEERKRGVPIKQILINYECYFVRSENTFINDDELLNQLYSAKKPYYTITISGISKNYPIKVYNVSKLSDVRFIAVDTATKYGSDFYAIVGVTSEGEIILEYNDKLSVDEAIDLIKKLDQLCPNGYFIIERNMGSHIIELLENDVKMYYSDNKPGIFTTEKNKKTMFVILKEYLYRNPHLMYSESILRQLLTLKTYKNSFRSDSHDDLAMAYAIAIYVTELERLKEETTQTINDENILTVLNNISTIINTGKTNNMLTQNNNGITIQIYNNNQAYNNSESLYYNPFETVDMFIRDFYKKTI